MTLKNLVLSGKQIVPVVKCAFSDWLKHRAASKGAALAFYTLFSLAPILVLVIAVAGLFYGDEAARGQLLGQLRGLMGAQSAEAIQMVLAGARNKDSGVTATVIATLLLIVGATSVFSELKDSLDEIWDVPKPAHSSWWDVIRTRLLSFGVIIVLGFLLLVSLAVSAVLAIFDTYVQGLWKEGALLLTALAWLVSFVVIAALFAVIFKILPGKSLSWRDVVVGAIGTAALFEVGKLVIGLYIGNSGVASSFGAAGSMIALLLWVYYSSQILFLGAEFTRQYALQLGSLRDERATAATGMKNGREDQDEKVAPAEKPARAADQRAELLRDVRVHRAEISYAVAQVKHETTPTALLQAAISGTKRISRSHFDHDAHPTVSKVALIVPLAVRLINLVRQRHLEKPAVAMVLIGGLGWYVRKSRKPPLRNVGHR